MDEPLSANQHPSDYSPNDRGGDALTVSALQQALAITAEIFPGPATVKDEYNPENPTDRWQTIVVTAVGDAKEIVDRKVVWYNRTFEALGPACADITIRVLPRTP